MHLLEFTTVGVAILTLCLSVNPLVVSADETQIDSKNNSNRQESHNLIIGERVDGDGLLYFQTIYVKHKFLWFVTLDVPYPTGNEKAAINYIEIIDLKTDGSGGYASIISGGVGNRGVIARFKSKLNGEINFNISVYGK